MNPASVDSIITRLRPRDVGGIIDQAFRLYRKHFLTFLAIIAVVYVPTQLVVQGATLPLLGSMDTMSDPNAFDSSSENVNQLLIGLMVLVGVILVFALLGAVLLYISQGALTSSVADSYLDKPVSFGNAYRGVGPRILSLLGYMGLQVLIVALAVVLFLVPFFALALSDGASGAAVAFSCLVLMLMFPAAILITYISIRLRLVVPAIVIEGLGPIQAIRRSWRLVENYWWRTFGITVLLEVLATIVQIGPAYIFIGLAEFVFSLDPLVNQAVTSFITVLTGMFFLPLQLIAMTLYYFDLRVRKEGFDLDAAMRQAYPSGYGYGQAYGQGGSPQPAYGAYGQTQGQWQGHYTQPQSQPQANPTYPPTLGYQQPAQQAQVESSPLDLVADEGNAPYGTYSSDPLGLYTPTETQPPETPDDGGEAQPPEKREPES